MNKISAERAIYGIVGGQEFRVQVSIGVPYQEGETDWSCSYAFDTGDCPVALKSGSAGGVDCVQALLNALYGVGHALNCSGIEWDMFSVREKAADKILPRENGFPRAGLNVMFRGTEFRKRVQAYVACEVEQAMKARSSRI